MEPPKLILWCLLCCLQSTFLANGVPTVTDQDIQLFTEYIFDMDNDNTADKVLVDMQQRYNGGWTPLRELLKVDATIWSKPTYSALQAIFKNEKLEDSTKDDITLQHNFLKTVIKTQVMAETKKFLEKVGVFRGNDKDFESFLYDMWFKTYRRGGVLSSGFKHVFMAEMKMDHGTAIVNGMHNWLFFALEQYKKDIDYLGWKYKRDFKNRKGSVMGIKFTWRKMIKETGSMFVGTSPQLELALYTTCFMVRRNDLCPIAIGGINLNLQTFSQDNAGPHVIGTAFPK